MPGQSAPRANGVARKLVEVEPAVEQDGLDPQLVRQLDQAELLDLAAPRPRVADEHGVSGTHGRPALLVDLVDLARERSPGRHDCDSRQCDHQGDLQAGTLRRVGRLVRRDRDGAGADEQPAGADRAARGCAR